MNTRVEGRNAGRDIMPMYAEEAIKKNVSSCMLCVFFLAVVGPEISTSSLQAGKGLKLHIFVGRCQDRECVRVRRSREERVAHARRRTRITRVGVGPDSARLVPAVVVVHRVWEVLLLLVRGQAGVVGAGEGGLEVAALRNGGEAGGEAVGAACDGGGGRGAGRCEVGVGLRRRARLRGRGAGRLAP